MAAIRGILRWVLKWRAAALPVLLVYLTLETRDIDLTLGARDIAFTLDERDITLTLKPVPRR